MPPCSNPLKVYLLQRWCEPFGKFRNFFKSLRIRDHFEAMFAHGEAGSLALAVRVRIGGHGVVGRGEEAAGAEG